MRNPLLAPVLGFVLACSFAASPARAQETPSIYTAPSASPQATPLPQPPPAAATPLYAAHAPRPQEIPPPDPPPDPPQSPGRRTAFLASGIVVTSFGGLFLTGGAALLFGAGSAPSDDDDPFPGIVRVAGGIVLGVGILHAIVGGVLLASGLKPKPRLPGTYTMSSLLLPTAAPGGRPGRPGGLAWTF
jgi:uncharacterized membrane protein